MRGLSGAFLFLCVGGTLWGCGDDATVEDASDPHQTRWSLISSGAATASKEGATALIDRDDTKRFRMAMTEEGAAGPLLSFTLHKRFDLDQTGFSDCDAVLSRALSRDLPEDCIRELDRGTCDVRLNTFNGREGATGHFSLVMPCGEGPSIAIDGDFERVGVSGYINE